MDRSLAVILASAGCLAALFPAPAAAKPAPTPAPAPTPTAPAPTAPGIPLSKPEATPAAAPAAAPAAPPAPLPAPKLGVDELLTKLETADKDLRTLTASIQYVKVFPDAQGGDKHTRRGTISFMNLDPGLATGKPRRMFAVTFNELIIDTTRRVEPRSFVFDGSWLVERDDVAKQFFTRRVVAPGSDADPMRIGEGPLPLPIGQRRADITGRFDVATVSPLENVPQGEQFAKLRELLADTHQLKLLPKAGTPGARDYREIRLWYRTSDLIPVFAQSTTADGSKHEVFLLNTKRNEALTTETFSTAEPKKSDGWTVDVAEFRGDAEPMPTGDAPKPAPTPAPAPAPEKGKAPPAEQPK
jgi:hypothetical protein